MNSSVGAVEYSSSSRYAQILHLYCLLKSVAVNKYSDNILDSVISKR